MAGFNFEDFKNDVGTQVQNAASDWLKNEISNRLNPPQTAPQPPATQTVAENDATKIGSMDPKKLMLYVGAVLAAVVVLAIALSKKSGGKRAK